MKSLVEMMLALKQIINLQMNLIDIIETFKRLRVYSPLRDGLCGLELADMQSLNKFNKGIKYLLCAIDLFSKYA